MPAQTPIAAQITANILATLQQVKKRNGYQIDLDPRRVKEKEAQVKQGLALVIPLERRRFHEPGSPDFENPYHPQIEWVRTYKIRAFVLVSENNDTPLDDFCEAVAADIEKAMMAPDDDGVEGSFRGGLAMETILLGDETHLELKPSHIDVFVDVHYSTFVTDPYKRTD